MPLAPLALLLLAGAVPLACSSATPTATDTTAPVTAPPSTPTSTTASTDSTPPGSTAPPTSAVPATTDGSPPTTAAGPGVTAQAARFSLDAPMSRLVAVPRGDTLLVFSGLTAGKASMNRVFTLDPRTGTTTATGKLPQAVHDAAGTALGDRVLLIGGGEQNVAYPDVVDVAASPPTKIGRIDVGRSDNSAVTVGDTAYVLGGYDERSIVAPVLASGDGVSWRKVVDLPTPVRYGAVAADGPTIYVFGGVTDKAQTTDIQAIDTTDGSARKVGTLPVPLGHAAAVNLGGSIYVLGGRTGAGTSTATTTTSATIYRFDPATASVTEVGKLPKPVADFGVAVLGDTAYVLGGERGDTAVNEVVTVRRS